MARRPDRIYKTARPSVGLVIGTYAAAPYIHLGLESRRRNYPHVPALIHDDASDSEAELAALCRDYGAQFSRNLERLGHFVGDLAVFVRGLDWAHEQGFDLLVKFSRRFVPLFDWTRDLQELAWASQYATFSNRACSCGLRFRTECVALHVESWFACGAVDILRRRCAPGSGVFVESLLHGLARRVHRESCARNREYEMLHPKPAAVESYGDWDIMGQDRYQHIVDVLWRHSCGPAEYCRSARQYGLAAYGFEDFQAAAGATGAFDAGRRLE